MHWEPSPITAITHPQSYLQVSAQVRATYLSRAILWEDRSIPKLSAGEIRQGEPAEFRPGQWISCTYVYKTHKELGGTTPKFECKARDGETYRVKYGIKAHTTVAASRLFWALGFGAAISTPVKVICRGCPPDPWNTHGAIEGKNTFKEAVVQEMKKGKEITIDGKAEVGWSWKNDLPLVSEKLGGASQAQVDALKLMAVLVQHGDSKPAQQKLICRPQDYDKVKNGCRMPYMYIYDLGETFGSDGLRVHPLDFERWSHKTVFRDRATCRGNLRQNAGNGRDGLTLPIISERGRLFLSKLLRQFIADRSRVVAVFAVAQMEMADSRHTPDEWADVFISKAQEIINHPACPE